MGDYADDAWDPCDRWSWTDRTRHDAGMHTWRHKPRTVCKYCGLESLHWSDSSGRWRLVDVNDTPHDCRPSIKQAFAQMKLDKDPSLAYNAYLNTIPGWTEKDYYETRT